MKNQTQRAVFSSAGISTFALLCGLGVIYYPPNYDHFDYSIFELMKSWTLVMILGVLYFISKKRLGLFYLTWSLVISSCAVLYHVIIFKNVLAIYGMPDWIYQATIAVIVTFFLCHFAIRCRVGSYQHSVCKGRVVPGTFHFHIDNHVDISLNNGRETAMEAKLNKILLGSSGMAAGMSSTLEGSPLIGIFYTFATSITSLLFAWFIAVIVLPDFIFCLIAGCRKAKKQSDQ